MMRPRGRCATFLERGRHSDIFGVHPANEYLTRGSRNHEDSPRRSLKPRKKYIHQIEKRAMQIISRRFLGALRGRCIPGTRVQPVPRSDFFGFCSQSKVLLRDLCGLRGGMLSSRRRAGERRQLRIKLSRYAFAGRPIFGRDARFKRIPGIWPPAFANGRLPGIFRCSCLLKKLNISKGVYLFRLNGFPH